MVFSTDGFVCRVIDTGGSEKYIRLITPARGRLQVLVKGGKSPKSGRTACSQLFIWGNYEIGEEGGRYWLKTGSVNNVFSTLPEDLARNRFLYRFGGKKCSAQQIYQMLEREELHESHQLYVRAGSAPVSARPGQGGV